MAGFRYAPEVPYRDARPAGAPILKRGCLALVAALTACRSPAPAPVIAPAASPRLVVLIVIDQLPSWMFERDRALFTGGLGRLLREGGYVRHGELPYANTFTAPGHAMIGTGATPNLHGVVGNQWWRRAEQREQPAERDLSSPILSLDPLGKELPADLGASSRALRIGGVADALRVATHDRGRTLSIGLKARAACFLSGKQPELAVWYEPLAGGMTTSTAYATSAPPWLAQLARTRPASRFVGQTWLPLDAALLAKHTRIADDAPGEGALHGLGVAFPHLVHDPEELVHTPFADEIVMDAVLAALDPMQLGVDDVPDLLAISFNAHDYAGHNWGPDSWETLDLTLRLDASLGTLFAELDRRLGADGWAAVLTSDHGATPLPERSTVAGAKRLPPADIAAAGGALVAKVSSDEVFMTPAWGALPPAAQHAALVAAATSIRAAFPDLDVFESADTSHCAEPGLAGDVCRAIVPGESGELYLAPHRGFVVTEYKTGTHHDAPNPDNQQVPILVRAPGLRPQTIERASSLQIAPTVAALLGVPPPPAATAPTLFGIAARPRARR